MLNKVDIANQALRKFGGQPIQAFDDETPAGSAVRSAYDEVVRGLLSEYPWSFVKDTVALARLADVADASGYTPSGWRFAFQLPAGALAPPDKYLADPRRADAPLRQFEIQGQTLFADVEKVWAVADLEPDPAVWPAYFVSAVVACLAVELVMPITANASMRETLAHEAWGTPTERRMGGKLGVARHADARKQSSVVLQGNPLLAARRG